MAELVTYQRTGRTARIRMDDGKVNAMGVAMLSALHRAFDRASEENAVVVLSGRESIFSAGFDLKVFSAGGAEESRRMLKLGAELRVQDPLVPDAGDHRHYWPRLSHGCLPDARGRLADRRGGGMAHRPE